MAIAEDPDLFIEVVLVEEILVDVPDVGFIGVLDDIPDDASDDVLDDASGDGFEDDFKVPVSLVEVI